MHWLSCLYKMSLNYIRLPMASPSMFYFVKRWGASSLHHQCIRGNHFVLTWYQLLITQLMTSPRQHHAIFTPPSCMVSADDMTTPSSLHAWYQVTPSPRHLHANISHHHEWYQLTSPISHRTTKRVISVVQLTAQQHQRLATDSLAALAL